MRSQGWCGEARLQVSEEGAVSGRLTRDGGTVSVTSFECRDETSVLLGLGCRISERHVVSGIINNDIFDLIVFFTFAVVVVGDVTGNVIVGFLVFCLFFTLMILASRTT
jgi:hypothetical protein